MKKVVLISEYLNPPYDEGIKKTVYNLYKDLKLHYELKVVSRFAFEDTDIHCLKINKLFLNKKLKRLVNDFKPDVLIYFPFASSTFASYLRQRVLRSYLSGKSKSLFIALQPKKVQSWQKWLINFIKPEFALTPSLQLKKGWDKLEIRNQLFPLLTDLNVFKPIDNSSRKKVLRKKYNLPSDAFIISHMGHLNEGRNLKSLIPLQKAGYQVVIVGSSSTPIDSTGPAYLKKELENEGIIILDGYIEHIEEVYQLSDLYIFPVIAQTGSIGMPLSIMEARACGVPVITTDFGSLKYYLGDDYGGIFYTKPAEFLKAVEKVLALSDSYPTKTKVPEINRKFYDIIHAAIEDVN